MHSCQLSQTHQEAPGICSFLTNPSQCIKYIFKFSNNSFFTSRTHFSEISFSNNLETLKFKNFPFWAIYVDAYPGIAKQVNSLLDSNLKKLATMLCKYKVIWRQNNQGSVHILHNHRGGSLKCFCMIMGMGRGLALWWHKLISFFYKSQVFL